ncbi:glutathione S-transferase [Porticoccaceae bacterium]|jgi:glutathione S-transferase|nr:glutathione S-transferase [Porticoccaceae bacterium]MDA9014802.1 glutathione S-transferase [Porticoccaceae bacterium]
MSPILYSFRRCPYAIRARMTIAYASITLELREVALANKPQAMLAISPKGTVPVLQLRDRVIDESLEVMRWALNQSDPENWLGFDNQREHSTLIEQNDNEFKDWLDKYKYWDRFPQQSQQDYRVKAENFLLKLEQRLQQNAYLFGDNMCMADIAIFPFIRQFAYVDKPWFDNADYPSVQRWLTQFLQSKLFQQVMLKQAVWQQSGNQVQ